MSRGQQRRRRPTRVAITFVMLVGVLGGLGVVPRAGADVPPPVGTVTRFSEGVDRRPVGITYGPDGNLWVTTYDGIQRVTPTGDVSTFPVSGASPMQITSGSDGNLWFTTRDNSIGRITPLGVVTLFPISHGPASGDLSLWSIVSGPDGNLWFTSRNHGMIGRITTAGAVTLLHGGQMSGTLALTPGPGGDIWFSYARSDDGPMSIGHVTMAGEITVLDPTELAEQGYFVAYSMVEGSDGNIWFTDYSGIGRLTPDGVLTKFPLPASRPGYGIAAGADGNVWFVPDDSNKVVRVTPAGVMTSFPAVDDGTPFSPWPNGITTGPNGTLWFTNSGFPSTSPNQSIGTISSVVSGELPMCDTAPFSDVSVDQAFCGEIAWASSEGIVEGFADGSFRPTGVTSRQASAAFLYRLAGSPDGVDPTCTAAPFSDVSVDQAFCGEIAWASSEGIVEGFADGSFRPTGVTSRQASAAFLYRLAGSPDGVDPTCTAAPFKDVPTSQAFCGEIAWTTNNGITNGFSDGTFRPLEAVNRQAMAAFLYRLDLIVT